MSILESGLIYFPNKRNVFSNLTDNGIKILAEPPCRGMICLTDTLFKYSAEHRNSYGQYGIVLDKNWAISEGACKVIYVGKKGDVFNSFKSLFELMKPSLESLGDSQLDEWVEKLSRTAPTFSNSMGDSAYSHLLMLHDYMQTDEAIAESEWRIMRPHKFSYHEDTDQSELREMLVKVSKQRIIPTLQVSPKNLKAIICPKKEESVLKGILDRSNWEVEVWCGETDPAQKTSC